MPKKKPEPTLDQLTERLFPGGRPVDEETALKHLLAKHTVSCHALLRFELEQGLDPDSDVSRTDAYERAQSLARTIMLFNTGLTQTTERRHRLDIVVERRDATLAAPLSAPEDKPRSLAELRALPPAVFCDDEGNYSDVLYSLIAEGRPIEEARTLLGLNPDPPSLDKVLAKTSRASARNAASSPVQPVMSVDAEEDWSILDGTRHAPSPAAIQPMEARSAPPPSSPSPVLPRIRCL